MFVRLLVVIAALVVLLVLWHPTDGDSTVEVTAVAPTSTSASTTTTAPPPTTLAPTTVTVPRARTAPTVRAASVGAAALAGTDWTDNKRQPPAGHWTGTINGAPCGGSDLPSCRRVWIESKGDPRIWNGGCYAPAGWSGSSSPCGGSTASGAYQFVRGTWDGYGGHLNAADAPLEVQIEKAKLTYAGGAGCFHWSDC